MDGGTDAGMDAGTDGATEASVDAGTDAAKDGGTDAGMDSGMDAAKDAAPDGATEAGMDAAPDGATEAGWTPRWILERLAPTAATRATLRSRRVTLSEQRGPREVRTAKCAACGPALSPLSGGQLVSTSRCRERRQSDRVKRTPCI